ISGVRCWNTSTPISSVSPPRLLSRPSASLKRDIYEKAMAIVAAIRQGEFLPQRFRIRSAGAVLYTLNRDMKLNKASKEDTHQYHLGLYSAGTTFRLRKNSKWRWKHSSSSSSMILDRAQKQKALKLSVAHRWFPQLEVDVHPESALAEVAQLVTDLDVLSFVP